jgi:phospholipid transport system substrate-binding protein
MAALAGAGLMFAIVAEAAQQKLVRHAPSLPQVNTIDTPSSQADVEWQGTSLDDETRMKLTTSVQQPESDISDFEAVFARLSRIETAAGPQTVDPNAAAAAVRRMGDEAIAVLRDSALSAEMKQAKFQNLLARDFDMPLIARFALGRHWRNTSGAEKQAYVDAFSRFVLKTYASQLTDANIKSFQVTSSQMAGKRDVMVETRVVRSGGGILKLVWRLRARKGAYRVIDVVAEGISLALTKRQEFAAIIQASGGQVSPLINTLRSRAI